MQQLIALLKQELMLELEIAADTPLLSSGLIDSFKVVQLLDLVERNYGCAIEAREIGPDNFDTPAQILALIQAQR